MKKYLRNENAITLIALIITVVVMLILAGVTINLTLGENGIFTTAQKAAKNYTDSQNAEITQLNDFADSVVHGFTAGKIARTENGVQYVGDGVGNLIPVPVGFSYLEGTKTTGFVIKNDTDGNEFVWIPVGTIENYKRIGWTRDDWTARQRLDHITGRITRNDLDAQTYYWTEEMPEDERNSVTAYGGYYIGRYEAGVKDYETKDTVRDGTATWTAYKGDDTRLVIQGEQEVWNWITRDKAKAVAEGLYVKSTNNVTSKLCSSYAWDNALKFIETQNSTYPTNSTGGNYKVTTEEKGRLQTTGYHAINNIFDMGGNTWEWTTESASNPSDESCVHRGGAYNDIALNYPASHRGRYGTLSAYDSGSFRVALFI